MNASSNVMQTDPTNTAEPGHVGELRIGLESLKTLSNLWYVKLKYFSHAKRCPLLHNDTLVILQTNIRLIDSKGCQLDTVMMRNHRVKDNTVNMQHSLLHLPMSRLMDFSRHPTATQIAIRSYCFHHYGLGSDAVFVKLTLEPLEGKACQVNVFNQKFPKPIHMTTIASDHIGHHKTPSDTIA